MLRLSSAFPTALILRGLLDVVDDENFGRTCLGLKLEAELVVQILHKLGSGRLTAGIRAVHAASGPLEGEIVVAREASVIDDGAVEVMHLRQRCGKQANGDFA